MELSSSLVGIYLPFQALSDAPKYSVRRQYARQIVENGLAGWTHHAKHIRLYSAKDDVRDRSCRMGPKLILAFVGANGDRAVHLAAITVEGWR